MHEVPAALLEAALRYGLARVGALATVAELEALAGRAAADAAAAQSSLTQANAHATACDAALRRAGGPDLALAASEAWKAIEATLAALRAVTGAAGPDPGGEISRLVGKVVADPSPRALIAQLGLPAPAVAVAGDGVRLTWSGNDVDLTILNVRTLSVVVALGATGPALEFRADGVTVDLGEGTEGLVKTLIGAAGSVQTRFVLTIDEKGLTADGAAGPISLPGSLSAQVVGLDGLALSLVPKNDRISLEVRSRLSATLAGVLGARVDGAGVAFWLSAAGLLSGQAFWEAGGIDYLTPNGIGISLSAGPARGGGYLAEIPGRGFGGALQVALGPVEVTGYGLFAADANGVSFVIVVSVRFVVPIELGFLFTLNAVGGIVGYGVDIDTERLASGLKDGILDTLFFPADVVKAAPGILAALSQIFPRHPGGFVVGPMVQLGWGRPISLATLDVGVILAVPDPVLVIIGRARSALPAPEVAIIDLRAAILVQVGRGIILLRAELFSSRIAFLTVQGGIGLLIRFGDDPTVVFSAGGFHPTYAHKPAELADLSRIGAELSPPVGLQLRLQGYVAITPNTLQFGGSIEIALSIAIAAVRGRASLDTIIQFDPFQFTANVSASAHVEVFGISLLGVDLALEVSGPGPFRISGTGKITLPWPLPDPSLDFGPITIGSEPPPGPPPPAIRPRDEVARALADPKAWRRVDRQGQRVPARLTTLAESETATIVEPWGLLSVTQRAFPLEMVLDRVGPAPVAPAGCRLSISAVHIGGDEATRSGVVESFPIGQFLQLTKDEQLQAPEFEDRPGGVAIDPAGVGLDPTGAGDGARRLHAYAASATLEYEEFWPGRPARLRGGSLFLSLALQQLLVDASPQGSSALRVADRYAPADAQRSITVVPVTQSRLIDTDTGAEIADFAPWTDALHTARANGLGVASLTRVAP